MTVCLEIKGSPPPAGVIPTSACGSRAKSRGAADVGLCSIQGEVGTDAVRRLIICGGGPGGIGPLVLAARTGRLNRLLRAGVIAMEQDSPETYGAGTLGRYDINSNTSASAFIAHFLKASGEETPGIFAGMAGSEAVKDLERFGTGIAPLPMVGALLALAGTQLRNSFQEYDTGGLSKICCRHKVQQLQINADGTVSCEAEARTRMPNGSFTMSRMRYTAEMVALALGGQQAIPLSFDTALRRKTLLGLNGLSPEGVNDIRARLSSSRSHRVVIIGGAHTAFSVAWSLLHKVTGKDNLGVERSRWNFKKNEITIVHRSKVRLFYSTVADATRDGYTDFDPKEDLSPGGRVNPFSGLRGDSKALLRDIQSGKEKRISLCKVRPEEAENLGKGPFWKSLLGEAELVVIASGIGTTMVPIMDAAGTQIELAMDRFGKVRSDSEGCLLAANGEVLSGVLGLGVGHGQPVNSLSIGGEARDGEKRADGVRIYMSTYGEMVLRHALGDDALFAAVDKVPPSTGADTVDEGKEEAPSKEEKEREETKVAEEKEEKEAAKVTLAKKDVKEKERRERERKEKERKDKERETEKKEKEKEKEREKERREKERKEKEKKEKDRELERKEREKEREREKKEREKEKEKEKERERQREREKIGLGSRAAAKHSPAAPPVGRPVSRAGLVLDAPAARGAAMLSVQGDGVENRDCDSPSSPFPSDGKPGRGGKEAVLGKGRSGVPRGKASLGAGKAQGSMARGGKANSKEVRASRRGAEGESKDEERSNTKGSGKDERKANMARGMEGRGVVGKLRNTTRAAQRVGNQEQGAPYPPEAPEVQGPLQPIPPRVTRRKAGIPAQIRTSSRTSSPFPQAPSPSRVVEASESDSESGESGEMGFEGEGGCQEERMQEAAQLADEGERPEGTEGVRTPEAEENPSDCEGSDELEVGRAAEAGQQGAERRRVQLRDAWSERSTITLDCSVGAHLGVTSEEGPGTHETLEPADDAEGKTAPHFPKKESPMQRSQTYYFGLPPAASPLAPPLAPLVTKSSVLSSPLDSPPCRGVESLPPVGCGLEHGSPSSWKVPSEEGRRGISSLETGLASALFSTATGQLETPQSQLEIPLGRPPEPSMYPAAKGSVGPVRASAARAVVSSAHPALDSLAHGKSQHPALDSLAHGSVSRPSEDDQGGQRSPSPPGCESDSDYSPGPESGYLGGFSSLGPESAFRSSLRGAGRRFSEENVQSTATAGTAPGKIPSSHHFGQVLFPSLSPLSSSAPRPGHVPPQSTFGLQTSPAAAQLLGATATGPLPIAAGIRRPVSAKRTVRANLRPYRIAGM